jgi:hypothetical protein
VAITDCTINLIEDGYAGFSLGIEIVTDDERVFERGEKTHKALSDHAHQ